MSIVSLYYQFQQQEPISSVIKHYNVLYTIYSFEGFRKAFLLLFKANPRMKFRGIYSTFFYLDAFDHSPDRSEILHYRFFYMHFLLPLLSHTKKKPQHPQRGISLFKTEVYTGKEHSWSASTQSGRFPSPSYQLCITSGYFP